MKHLRFKRMMSTLMIVALVIGSMGTFAYADDETIMASEQPEVTANSGAAAENVASSE